MLPFCLSRSVSPCVLESSLNSTGIGDEHLNILYRWAAYLCFLLSLIHTMPFSIQPIYDCEGSAIFHEILGVGKVIVCQFDFHALSQCTVPAVRSPWTSSRGIVPNPDVRSIEC